MKLIMRGNQTAAGTDYNFVQAVLALKAEQKEGKTNTYDQYVQLHYDNVLAGHFGPAFFAWHREFLRRFEGELQRITGDQWFGLPYWDWSVDNSKTSSIWGPNFVGGNGVKGFDWQVQDGPFAFNARKEGDPRKWSLNVRSGSEPFPYLVRQLGESRYAHSLPTPANVSAALQATPYDVSPWSSASGSGFRNRAEGFYPGGPNQMHNRVHEWVGGSMTTMTSPNDPVFWLHHCFMDKLWADWQMMHQDQAKYLPDGGAAPDHNLTDPMPPWNTPNETVTPADVLDHRKLGYRYDTEDYLLPEEELYQGQWIWSANKKYSLLYGDRERVLWLTRISDGTTLWQSDTNNLPPGRLFMRKDGNLVIYHIDVPYPHGKGNPYEPNPIWESKTPGHPGGRLRVVNEDGGYLALYEPGNRDPYWRRPL